VEHAKDWPKSVAKRVGKRVAYFRARATDERGHKLTAQALANRCTDLGLPLGRPTIAKLEKGLRETITVGELQVLAKALSVSPADLVFPLGQAADVEVLPGEYVGTWDAVQWFSGSRMPHRPADGEASLIHLYQLHDVILQEWWPAEKAAGPGGKHLVADMLRTVRTDMRRRDLLLPDLPPSLAYIDNGEPDE
jgi:transcriptional regulator with XRE-family HTH domain